MDFTNAQLSYRDESNALPTIINKILFFSVAVNPPSITNAQNAEVAVTLPGVGANDVVFACPPASLETGLVYTGARVSAIDTVQLNLSNITAAPIDGASRTWQFLVFNLLKP